MKTLISTPNAVRRFFCEPLSPAVWGVYRLAVGSFCLLQSLVLLPDLLLHYGQNGLVAGQISDGLASPYVPTLGKLFSIFSTILRGSSTDADVFVYVFYTAFLLVLVGFTVGFKTPTMAFLAWLMHLTLVNTERLGAYGVEMFCNIALFYAVFSPTGQAFSVDSRRRCFEPSEFT